MDLGLSGKTVIVTGGSGGIGRGLLMEFAREGCNVINASRDMTIGAAIEADAKSQGLKGTIVSVKTDVTDRASVDAMVKVANETFGLVDVLVNNAGGVAAQSPFEDLSQETRDWERALNVDGVIHCTQAVAHDMLSRKTGSVINISSNSGLLGEAANHIVHYGAVKGFVNSFSKSLAYEWGPRGVRVRQHRTGLDRPLQERRCRPRQLLEPPGRRQSRQAGADAGGAGRRPAAEHGQPADQARFGRPEDIAYLTLVPAASDVSGYITGQLISVSGGVYMP